MHFCNSPCRLLKLCLKLKDCLDTDLCILLQAPEQAESLQETFHLSQREMNWKNGITQALEMASIRCMSSSPFTHFSLNVYSQITSTVLSVFMTFTEHIYEKLMKQVLKQVYETRLVVQGGRSEYNTEMPIISHNYSRHIYDGFYVQL